MYALCGLIECSGPNIYPCIMKRKFDNDVNSNNINKTNNHLSSKLNSLNTKKTTTYDFQNPGPGLGQAQKHGRVKPVNGMYACILNKISPSLNTCMYRSAS